MTQIAPTQQKPVSTSGPVGGLSGAYTGANWHIGGKRASTLAPQKPTGISQPASTPTKDLSYQTSISVGPATDKQVLQGLVSQPQRVDAGSQTGQRAFDDFSRSMNAANSADIGLQADTANAQQHMNSQQKRSEASMAGLQNQQAIYQNAVDRFRSQLGLATDLEASRLGYLYGLQANSIRRLQNVNRNNP